MAYAVRIATGRDVSQPLWRELRRRGGPLTLDELHRASRAHPNAIQLRLKRWSRCGLVVELPPEPVLYALAPAHRECLVPPTEGSLSAAAWRALRKLGRPASLDEILAASGCSDRPLYCRLRRWRGAGFIIEVKGKARRFAMSSEACKCSSPPKVGAALDPHLDEQKGPPRTQRQRLWSAMRVLKTFDVPVLMMTAEVTRRSCEDFLNLLQRTGYVRRLDIAAVRTGPGNLDAARDWSTYQLIRSTGPHAPRITSGPGPRTLIDGNGGERVPVGPGLRRRASEVNHGR